MEAIKIYKSPWKALRLFALTIPFVIIGIWMIGKSESGTFDWYMGWFGTAFFGLGIPLGLFNIFDKRPQIIIDEIGVFDRMIGPDVINWEIIEDAYLTEVHRQRFICLVVNEAYEPSKKKSKWFQRSAKLSKALGFQELNVSLGSVKVDEEKLTALIIAMSQADQLERKELLRTLPERI